MPYINVYSKKAGDPAIGGVVGDSLELTVGLWRLHFNTFYFLGLNALLLLVGEQHKKYASREKRLKIEGKEAYLLELDFVPIDGKLTILVEVVSNPIPVIAIAGASLALIGVLIALAFTLTKVEKVLDLPMAYVIGGLVAVGMVFGFLKTR